MTEIQSQKVRQKEHIWWYSAMTLATPTRFRQPNPRTLEQHTRKSKCYAAHFLGDAHVQMSRASASIHADNNERQLCMHPDCRRTPSKRTAGRRPLHGESAAPTQRPPELVKSPMADYSQ